MPPNIKNFLQNPGLRNRFLVEAMIAVLHPPPTGYPMPLPQRGDCRMGGYGAPPERDLSPYCYNVYTSYVGLFMFARLCDGTRLGRSGWRTARASTSPPALPPISTGTCSCASCGTCPSCGSSAR